MNAVEIEAAVSELAAAPYDAAEFPFQFLTAFDKKETTLKRLRKGDTNKADVFGAVLLINNIHLAICPAGQTLETLELLKASPKTAAARAKFIFATDGSYFEAEDVTGAQEPVADFLPNLANHFGFFLPLEKDPTYLLAPVEIVATWNLANIHRFKFEQTIHRIFASAQLQLKLTDRFGVPVEPREWFVVPLSVINEVMERIQDESITGFVYDSAMGRLRLAVEKA